MLENYPTAVKSLFLAKELNQSIELYHGGAVLSQSDLHLNSDKCVVELAWLPQPRILFNLEAPPGMLDIREPATLELPAINKSLEVFITRMTVFTGPIEGQIIPRPSQDRRRFQEIIFHLPNFTRFQLGEIAKYADRISRERLVLDTEEFELTIDAVENIGDLNDNLKKMRGYAITHTGRLAKKEATSINLKEMTFLSGALTYFFSFVRGAWCGPMLTVGKYSSNKPDYHFWDLPKFISNWRNVHSWFAEGHPDSAEHIGAILGNFVEKWRDKNWHEPLKQAIYWYVVANTGGGGIEGSIVLAQTGLELLSWVKLTEDPATRRLSGDGFNKLSADDKMSLLLLDMQIPRELPQSLVRLSGSSLAKRSKNAFDLLRLIRNSIVHPSLKNRTQVSDVHVGEAWMLSLWYLELAILNIVGYNGVYRSRVRLDGTTEAVPWAQDAA